VTQHLTTSTIDEPKACAQAPRIPFDEWQDDPTI
jgi:hypothetical protein